MQALFEIIIEGTILFVINSLSFLFVVVTAMRNQQQQQQQKDQLHRSQGLSPKGQQKHLLFILTSFHFFASFFCSCSFQ